MDDSDISFKLGYPFIKIKDEPHYLSRTRFFEEHTPEECHKCFKEIWIPEEYH